MDNASPSRKKIIIIVGAGMAGIAAARFLINNDANNRLEVIVLEGRDRIGGRVFTNRVDFGMGSGFKDGSKKTTYDPVPIDLGAAWIHDYQEQNPLCKMAQILKMKLHHSFSSRFCVYNLNKVKYSNHIIDKMNDECEDVLYTAVRMHNKRLLTKDCRTKLLKKSLEDIIIDYLGEHKYFNRETKNYSSAVLQAFLNLYEFEFGSALKYVSPSNIDNDWCAWSNDLSIPFDSEEEEREEVDMAPVEVGMLGLVEGLVNNHFGALDGLNTDFSNCDHVYNAISNLNSCPDFTGCAIAGATSGKKVETRLNHKVTSVVHNSGAQGSAPHNSCNQHLPCKVHATVGRTSESATVSDSIELEADAVIVTLPLGVLKQGTVSFNPPLSTPKQAAIHRAGFGNVVKIVLEFEQMFWPADREFFMIADRSLCDPSTSGHGEQAAGASGSSSNNDRNHGLQLRGLCTLFWNMYPVNGSHVLVTYGLGDGATLIDRMSDEEVMKLITSRLVQLDKCIDSGGADQEGKSVSKRNRSLTPIRWVRTNWSSDEHARGAYSYVPVELGSDGPDVWRELGKRESDTCYFAGEATMESSTYRSSVLGAYLSGLRAGEELLQTLFGEGMPESDVIPVHTPTAAMWMTNMENRG